MVSKKAYIRTIEAVIAIVLLLFTSYLIAPKELTNPRETPYVVESAQEYAISQATSNESLRNIIINYDSDTNLANRSLNGIIENRLPAGYKYSSVICTSPDCVTLPELQTSVYMNDVLITGETSTGEQVIRLVRVWFWREG